MKAPPVSPKYRFGNLSTSASAGSVSPRKLRKMDARLVNLLLQGACIGVRIPEPASRMAILMLKAEQLGVALPEEVARLIVASSAGESVGSLEGKLVRIAAYAALASMPVDMSLAKWVLGGR